MNSKKPFIVLTVLLFASFGIIALLAFLSKNTHEKKNGFNRRLQASAIKSRKQITFPVEVNKIIGLQAGNIYFQGHNPYELFKTDLNGDSLTRKQLTIPSNKKLRSGFQMYMHGSHVYISGRNMPGIIDYNLDSGTFQSHVLNQYYSKETLVSKDQFIFRTINPNENDPVFLKLDFKNQNLRIEDHFSEKSEKGNFPTDGILYYDSTTHLACYTYFYQNGFICMDTNLNLIVKARTIDTVTKREVQVAHVRSSYTMKQPPKFVNYIGAVADGNLFLQSMLQADNEYSLDFTENTVIDIYNLKTGAYKSSFYIPPYKGSKPYQFVVFGKKLCAVYGKTVVLYDLSLIADL